MCKSVKTSKLEMLFFTIVRRWPNIEPKEGRHLVFAGIVFYHKVINPVNTKHLYNICTASAQRLRRWSNIVQMLYKCFVFTGK